MRWIIANETGTWHLENIEEDEYRDYSLRLPDTNGASGLLLLTFNLDEATAHLSVRLCNGADVWERGKTEDSPCGIQVPLAWANAIASGVDGYTMKPPTGKETANAEKGRLRKKLKNTAILLYYKEA